MSTKKIRIPFVIAGTVIAVIAVSLAVGGGAMLWANAEKDARGFVSTDDRELRSAANALVTGNVDMDLDGVEWLVDGEDFGDIRFEVESATDEPVFVGIAPTTDVERYLRDVSHTQVTGVDWPGDDVAYRERDGDRRPKPPGNARFWTASTEGAGKQTLEWHVADGDWSIVVMNADGSRGVTADVAAGAKLPWLNEAGWSVLGTGVLLGAGAILLLLAGFRPSRRTPIDPSTAPTTVHATV